jgi:hypothetical protein
MKTVAGIIQLFGTGYFAFIRYRLYLILMFFISACSKEVPIVDIERDTFFTTFPSDDNQWCAYIAPTADEGYLLIGATVGVDGFIKKIDKRR